MQNPPENIRHYYQLQQMIFGAGEMRIISPRWIDAGIDNSIGLLRMASSDAITAM